MTIRSEQEILKIINSYFPTYSKEVIAPRGDDCCVFNGHPRMCISSDLFLEDVHFCLSYFPPSSIGYKALAVNISDILAMGGIPLGFNLSLILPPHIDINFLKQIFQGMSSLAHRFNLYLAGGDISRGEKLGIDITIWGRIEKNILCRGKAQEGDLIFITGDIGLARAGLVVLEKGFCSRGYRRAIEQHLHPDISPETGDILRNNPYISSLMDVSDGIAQDLFRLLPVHLGAEIDISLEILPEEVKEVAQRVGEPAVEFALKGGEDYVFMGTIKKEGKDYLLKDMPKAHIIGEAVEKNEIRVNGSPLKIKGFDHFNP